MDTDLLKIQNPWWENRENIQKDPHLLAIQGKPYQFNRPILHEVTFDKGNIHILRGPRQVGKTTLIKLLIAGLIQNQKPSKNILYLSCESLPSFQELESILVFWLKEKREETFIFLDEISFVVEWQKAVLAIFNMGLLQNTVLILTGSNAKDLKESGERLPGRRGKGKDFLIYPLSFAEFKNLSLFADKKEEEVFGIYLKIGGFPLAIKDFCEKGWVSDDTYEAYRNWIIGDAHRYHLRQETLRQILFRIFQTRSSRITWPKLIENSPVKSHETALEYVEHLQDAFLSHVLHCYDPKRETVSPQKARKIYFIDPLLYAIAGTWQSGITNIHSWFQQQLVSPEFFGDIFEAIAVNHFKRNHPQVYFWYSTQDGKEVDMVIREEGVLKLFEIKSKPSAPFKALNQTVTILDPTSLLEQME